MNRTESKQEQSSIFGGIAKSVDVQSQHTSLQQEEELLQGVTILSEDNVSITATATMKRSSIGSLEAGMLMGLLDESLANSLFASNRIKHMGSVHEKNKSTL